MPRFFMSSPRLQPILQALIHWYYHAGSVNNLSRLLNELLQAHGYTSIIHPNRLHTVLSNDPRKTMNEATVSLLEAAIQLLPDTSRVAPGTDRNFAHLAEKIRWDWLQSDRRSSNIDSLAKKYDVPASIVEDMLKQIEPTDTPVEAVAALHGRPTATPALTKAIAHIRKPDWSYQDEAVTAIRLRIQLRPNGKYGVIIPTGGGKTRVGLRAALEYLHTHPEMTGKVVWFTHRLHLQAQAHAELQKLRNDGVAGIPPDATQLLAKRFEFVMIGQAEKRLEEGEDPCLVIVDEAHHAAAASYKPIFDEEHDFPVLSLTATPNRMDGRPIHIDEIAYFITYRQLVNRGVILMPEFVPFPVQDFDWATPMVEKLAKHVLDHAQVRYTKTLIIMPSIEKVERFYHALRAYHSQVRGHVLAAEDIGFVHSRGNSSDDNNEDFLAEFRLKRRGILVSAQMLLEGFDDPLINTVVVTYPSQSLVVLMQAAGRCVRHADGKDAAYVIQARNDNLEYYFENRWLYQEISDYLRPELLEVNYGDPADLSRKMAALLEQHHVMPAQARRILQQVAQVQPGDTCRVMLAGLPYFKSPDVFDLQSNWSALLEDEGDSEMLRDIFNRYCIRVSDNQNPEHFLNQVLQQYQITAPVTQAQYADLLNSMQYAKRELYDGVAHVDRVRHHRSTSWLRYVTFTYQPVVPEEVQLFLQDCYNKDALIEMLDDAAVGMTALVKIRVPLGGYEAHPLTAPQAVAFNQALEQVRAQLTRVSPASRFGVYAACLQELPAQPLPARLVQRLDEFLTEAGYLQQTLNLTAIAHKALPEATHPHQPGPLTPALA